MFIHRGDYKKGEPLLTKLDNKLRGSNKVLVTLMIMLFCSLLCIIGKILFMAIGVPEPLEIFLCYLPIFYIILGHFFNEGII